MREKILFANKLFGLISVISLSDKIAWLTPDSQVITTPNSNGGSGCNFQRKEQRKDQEIALSPFCSIKL